MPHNDDIFDLFAALIPGGVEMQEKHGQLEQAKLQTLPRDAKEGPHRQAWEKLGFVFGSDVDELFVEATFPTGWKKVPTDHDMYTDIVDERGRERGSIFYKAAFYDRRARSGLRSWFRIDRCCEGEGQPRVFKVVDVDGTVHFMSEPVPPRPDVSNDPADDTEELRQKYLAVCSQEDEARKSCSAWLDANYPGWDKDPTSYWN